MFSICIVQAIGFGDKCLVAELSGHKDAVCMYLKLRDQMEPRGLEAFYSS